MKGIAVFILVFLSQILVCGQNLVPNGQFERPDTSICPPPLIVGIPSDLSPWFTYGSPDYFNSCDTSRQVGVPQNFVGYQLSHSGRGYVGLISYTSSSSLSGEYIEVPLTTPLNSGQTYYVQFYVNLGNVSRYAIKNIGMLLTDTIYDPSYYTSNNITVYPQIVGDSIYSDSINWIAISGSFSANGGERYVTLGNFYSNAETISLYLGGTGSSNLEAYYYIDDVYVGPTPPMGVNEKKKEAEICIYPNPGSGIFTFKADTYIADKSELRIFDLAGKLLKTVVVQSALNEQKIDLSELKEGMYLYDLLSEGENVGNGKLIIQK